MPVTALNLPDPKGGGHKKVKFITDDSVPYLLVNIYQCDEDWIPQGKPTEGTHTDDEEAYHRLLRIEASKREHYVKEQSTNPEWNPDYIESTAEVVPDDYVPPPFTA